MSTLVKGTHKRYRRHLIGGDGTPLCGGGHGGKAAQYQTDLVGDGNCRACVAVRDGTQRQMANSPDKHLRNSGEGACA